MAYNLQGNITELTPTGSKRFITIKKSKTRNIPSNKERERVKIHHKSPNIPQVDCTSPRDCF